MLSCSWDQRCARSTRQPQCALLPSTVYVTLVLAAAQVAIATRGRLADLRLLRHAGAMARHASACSASETFNDFALRSVCERLGSCQWVDALRVRACQCCKRPLKLQSAVRDCLDPDLRAPWRGVAWLGVAGRS